MIFHPRVFFYFFLIFYFLFTYPQVIIIPVMQTFGLLFQDKFKTLNMSATDISVIINLNSAFGMGLGLINGPLLRNFGFRKVAIAAGVFFFIGMFATAFANSFGTFAFSYGIIACEFFFCCSVRNKIK